jgi:3-oxoacyl-[acyl-carrier-protein] synthase-1
MSSVKTPITYINTHGTSTPVGDTKELWAVQQVFGDHVPFISSTKSMTGHSLGAAGVQEAIYCLLMMQNKFMTPSINIDTLDPVAEGMPILRETKENVEFETVLSNSFGFGGTNCTLALTKWKGE